MRVAILGATGLTGVPLVLQALAEGHEVVAVVRSAKKLDETIRKDLSASDSSRLIAAEADIFSADSLQEHFSGVDAVLSVLGWDPRDHKHITWYVDATKAMAGAMRKVSCERLILMHAWYTKPEVRAKADPKIHKLLEIIGSVLDDMDRAEAWLRKEGGDLDWTVASPGALNKKPVTAKPFLLAPPEQYYQTLDATYFTPEGPNSIPRADVARFMLMVLREKSYVRQEVSFAV